MSERDAPPWGPAEMAEQFQALGQRAVENQRAFWQLFDPYAGPNGGLDLADVGRGVATFKTRVQSGGRISIPDTEREVLGIEEGDVVQAIVVPLEEDSGDE